MGQYFETYRATVKPEQCDHLGHMNVQYYIAALNDGTIELVPFEPDGWTAPRHHQGSRPDC